VDRIMSEHEDGSRIDLAYHLIFARPPAAAEASSSKEFLDDARKLLTEKGVAADQIDSEAWQACIRSLFRLNEFVYLD
jgi:hypothetical protein